MSNDVFPAVLGRVLRDFGSQVAISVAASAVAAGILAFPELLAPVSSQSALKEHPVPAAFVGEEVAASLGGKFAERYGAAEPTAEMPGRGLALPATLLMPMAVTWAAPVEAAPEPVAIAKLERPTQPAVVARAGAGPARERGRSQAANARPLQIAQVLQAPALEAAQPDTRESVTVLGVALPDSVRRAGRAIGGVADRIGAAGGWTVSAATSLLPSWSGSAR